MGAPIVLVSGKRVIIPGVYPEIDASALAPLLSGAARIPLVIGVSDGGDPTKVYAFRNLSEAKAVLRGGRVLSYLSRIFQPGPGMPGASVVAFIRASATASVAQYPPVPPV